MESVCRSAFILIILCCLALKSGAESHDDRCGSTVQDIPIKSTVASASFWANLRKSSRSISFKSNAIFNEAKDQAATIQPPENFCPKGCVVAKRAVMFFHSVPRKVLTDYEDAEHCAKLEKMSSQQPFRYANREIHTVDDLSEWISDLSKGDGKDGADLYEKCDASCSPRFQYLISQNDGKEKIYTVDATIVCGAARDKDDNQYNLDAYFRWNCE